MIQHPAVIALTGASLLNSLLLLAAGWQGALIRRHWNPQSGSERQLLLERRTYLVSTIVVNALVIQILSLFLFIFTVDRLHGLFVGAMCAAGTLHVNSLGYPTLLLKIATSLLAGIWLIINYADTQGYDYPFVRQKYALLYLLVPLALLDSGLQTAYFLGLHPDVITSCCGTLFGSGKPGIVGELVGFPARPMQLIFFGIMAATMLSGGWFWLKGTGGTMFASLSALAFLVAAVSLVSFVCLYIYELPTHHCPFCILQKEYGFVGYLLYLTLLAGGITGVGVGVLVPMRAKTSLAQFIPRVQRRLAVTSMLVYLLFAAIVAYRMTVTQFRLQ